MRSQFLSHYQLEITTADPIYFLKSLADQGVSVYDLRQTDEMHICMKVLRKQKDLILRTADRLGAQIQLKELSGPAAYIGIVKNRLAFIICVVALFILTLYIPTRVLFITVEGNENLHPNQIFDQAENAGLRFGVSRRILRSEKIKNALLESIPELKWVGINTYGCAAVISVQERDSAELERDSCAGVQGIYAIRDGIISSITVTKGTPICKPGQAVSAGQLLVSGYTDCGLVIRAEGAEGDVRARTNRVIDAVIPVCDESRDIVTGETKRWSLQFGKKQIKLYIDSGNSDTKCGRIIKERKLQLPGGFCLPMALIEETIVTYDYSRDIQQPDEGLLRELAAQYVSESMVAGKILRDNFSVFAEDGLYRLSGMFECEEMIGKLQNEEIEELDYRKNR